MLDDDETSSEVDFDIDNVDFSDFTSSQGQEEQSAPAVQEEPTGGNPAWNPYLEKVPAGMHSLVKPAFEAWDQDVQRRFQEINEQWGPYKKFRDEKVDPEYLDRARSFADKLQNDPVSVYQTLHQFFQQDQRYQAQLVQLGLMPDPNANAQQKPGNDDGELDADDPFAKIKELEEKLNNFQRSQFEALEQQQFEQQYNETYQNTVNEIETDFQAIETKTGPLPQMVKAEIVKQAKMMGLERGDYVSVIEAAPHVFAFMKQARAGMKSAPRPVGSGSVPQSQSFDPATADDNTRMSVIKDIVKRYQE